MQLKKKPTEVTPDSIVQLLKIHNFSLLSSFFETQSAFLTGVYKRYNSIETANIVLCFSRNMHLEIIRQREKDLNFNVSLDNFWDNFNSIKKPVEKISSIVNITAIPKETVRRKVKNLVNSGTLYACKIEKGYSWNLKSGDTKAYFKIINSEIESLSRFILKFSSPLGLNLNTKIIKDEIMSQFSFYWYHFLSCQLEWLKMWQTKLKDNDLLLISLQTTIPTLQYSEKSPVSPKKNVDVNSIFKLIGSIKEKNNFAKSSVSATTVSEITGIPRATCIRKLEKLVTLGFLVREAKTKRYFVNQTTEARTKNILNEDNVNYTIKVFSNYLSIILNSLIHNNKN